MAANWWVNAEWAITRVIERWHLDPISLGWDVDRILDANEQLDVIEDINAGRKREADLARQGQPKPPKQAPASRGHRKPAKPRGGRRR